MNWNEYKNTARSRGALAFECFAITSLLVEGKQMDQETLGKHLAYIGSLENEGRLIFAGPISDEAGENVVGGMIVLKVENRDAAVSVAAADPVHVAGIRSFTVRRWLINEGGMTLSFGLGAQRVAIS